MRYALAILFVSFMGLWSCSHAERQPAQQGSVTTPAPDFSKMTPDEFRTFAKSQLDPIAKPQLYVNERFQGTETGTWEGERAGFIDDMVSVFTVQQKLALKHAAEDSGRVFHYKSHGCLIGKMTIVPLSEREQKDPDFTTNRSLFRLSNGDEKEYLVVARYSNGVGVSQNDNDSDVRGMALKIFDVVDDNGGAKKTVDFNMTNSPVAFGNVQHDFVNFMNAQVDGGKTLLDFAIHDLKTDSKLVAATFAKIPRSVTQRQYWAGHPYLLRDTVNNTETAMKLNLLPRDNPPVSIPKGIGSNYLREDLVTRAAAGPIVFKLQVQLEKDKETTPIEANLTEWKEKNSHSIPVADVLFPAQIVYMPAGVSTANKAFNAATPAQRQAAQDIEAACRGGAFTPGHYVTQDRPLSNMGRGRIFSYQASEEGRGANIDGMSSAQIADLLSKVQLPIAAK